MTRRSWRWFFRKTLIYRDRLSSASPLLLNGSTIETLLAAAYARAGPGTTLRVIDFGGACGAHYFAARAFFGDRAALHIRWQVVETSTMVNRARELQNEELTFATSLSETRLATGDLDLTHSAGALQYVRDPARQLAELVDCGGRFLMLSRVGVTRGDHDVITVQYSRLGGPRSRAAARRSLRPRVQNSLHLHAASGVHGYPRTEVPRHPRTPGPLRNLPRGH